MYLSWHGQNCFKIQSEKTTLIIDPFDPAPTGLKLNAPKADIVVLTDPNCDCKEVKPITDAIFKISAPGEYEVKGIFIYGIFLKDKNCLIYHLETEQICLAHLGNLNRLLTEPEIEALNGIDILFVPVGGNVVLDAKKAADLISQIEPRIVIPMLSPCPALKKNSTPSTSFVRKSAPAKKTASTSLKSSKKISPPKKPNTMS